MPKKNNKTNSKAKSESKTTAEQNKEVKKIKLKLKNDDILIVKNNTAGNLIYKNHLTGDEYIWADYGYKLELTVADIKAMKAKDIAFFKENWISITGLEDDSIEFDDINDVYEALRISQYYNGFSSNFDIEETIKSFSPTQLKNVCKTMPSSLKNSFIIIANSMIKDGELYDKRKIDIIEDTLGVELTDGKPSE